TVLGFRPSKLGMRLHHLAAPASVAAAVVALAGLSPARDLAAQRPVAVSPGLFEYHSAFWVNLHHFLYEQARARGGFDRGRAIVAQASADTAGIDALSAS